MPKVSIIMPTYNVEKYFRQCLESVLNQSLYDIEIIPVDDGSPDNCGKIMDEYAKTDKRIKPIHKENGGYGSAVNVGIEMATGEYIAILETDDWVEPNTYEILYNNAKNNNTDITKCGFYHYDSLGEVKNIKNNMYNIVEGAPNKTFNILEYPILVIFHASVWAGIYRSSFIKNIKFIEKEYYQDFPFTVEALCKAKNISFVKKYLIHYRIEDGQSSSTNRSDKKLLFMPINTLKAKNILKRYNLYDELKEFFYVHAFLANYNFYRKIELKYKREYLILLRNIFGDIKCDDSFRYLYFENDEKEVIRGMLHKSVMAIMFGWYFKAVKSFFIHRYEHKNYEIIKILKFIKITKRSARLETIKRIRHLESLIVDISDKIDELKCTQSNKK